MTYIIPSIIAAVIIFFFARRLNKFEKEETALAMDTPDTSDAPLQSVGNCDIEASAEPEPEEADRKSGDEQEKLRNQETSKEEIDHTAQTVDIIVEILKKIGCQPIVEDRQTVSVKYQGENFQFYANGIMVNIYDLPWSEFYINDPNAQKIRDAINKANFSTLPMVLMMAPDKDGKVNVLSRYETILHPSCSINDEFIQYILNSFFTAQREVRGNVAELISQQQQPSANRRPVGFDTGTE
ncbi:MAG: hypothetical protein K2L45_03830 [Muribaculaceae bacterium]|nr:hypothetical protein [Muribaculaceae bacterium]